MKTSENDRIFGLEETWDDSTSEGTDLLMLIAEEASKVLPAPRRALKSRIMAAVAGCDQEEAAAVAEAKIIRSTDGQWIESGIPGITMKLLHQIEDPSVEQGHKRYSVLAKLAKGARYPHHRHVGYEECLVLEGDLHLNEIMLHGGDYIITEDGIEHVETYTENGCLLMLSTQLEDEILAA